MSFLLCPDNLWRGIAALLGVLMAVNLDDLRVVHIAAEGGLSTASAYSLRPSVENLHPVLHAAGYVAQEGIGCLGGSACRLGTQELASFPRLSHRTSKRRRVAGHLPA